MNQHLEHTGSTVFEDLLKGTWDNRIDNVFAKPKSEESNHHLPCL